MGLLLFNKLWGYTRLSSGSIPTTHVIMYEVKEQIEYLKKRLTELISLCERENTPEVSGDVRNIAQDIITRLHRLLDNILFLYFVTKVKPAVSEKMANDYEKRVLFPLCNKPSDLIPQLARFGAGNLNISDPEIYSIIEQSQPYNNIDSVLSYLRKYSNLGHRKLIAQKKSKNISLILGDVIKISDQASVTMNNVLVNGIPINHLKIDKGAVSGNLDARLNPRVEIQVSYLLEDDGVDVLWLCQNSLVKIEKIVDDFKKAS